MENQPQLHSAIVSMVSLAAGIAAKHPDMGLCQLTRLQDAGIPQHQIDAVIEIARHIRDESAEKLDAKFAEKTLQKFNESATVKEVDVCGCTATAGGTSCC